MDLPVEVAAATCHPPPVTRYPPITAEKTAGAKQCSFLNIITDKMSNHTKYLAIILAKVYTRDMIFSLPGRPFKLQDVLFVQQTPNGYVGKRNDRCARK